MELSPQNNVIQEDRRDYLADLVSLAQELSELSTHSSDPDNIIPVLQNFLQILESIDPTILSEVDMEEALHPSISILVLLLELGQHDETFSPLSMIVWKSYPRFIKRFQLLIDSATINRFYDILLPNCEDGLGMLVTALQAFHGDQSNAAEECREAIHLLKFFVQKLSITLVYCRRHFSPDIFIHGFRLLLVFLGLLHSYPTAFDNVPSLRSNCLQSLNKILSSCTSTQPSISTTSQLDAESQTTVVCCDKLDLEALRSAAQVQPCAASSFSSKSSLFLWCGISDYLSDVLDLLASSLSSYSSDKILRIAVHILSTFCHCQALICIFHPHRNPQSDAHNDIAKVVFATRSMMAMSNVSIFIWDFLVMQGCGLVLPQPGLISLDAVASNIAQLILIGIFDGMAASSQQFLFDRLAAMLVNCTCRNRDLLLSSLSGAIHHGSSLVKKSVLLSIKSYLLNKEDRGGSDQRIEWYARSLQIKHLLQDDDEEVRQLTLGLIKYCIDYAMQTSENGVANFDRFAISLLIVRSSLFVHVSPEPKILELEAICNTYVSKPVFGTVLLRFIKALSSQADYYLHAKRSTTDVPIGQIDKMTYMFETTSILVDCLIAYRLPNPVRSVMSKSVCLVAHSASAMYTLFKQRSKAKLLQPADAYLETVLQAILSALQVVDSGFVVYARGDVADDVFHADISEMVTHLCSLLSYEQDADSRSNVAWRVQQKVISLLSKLIRLFPKRAGMIAKMMASPTVIAVVKAYHVGKSTAQLSSGSKLDLDEEQVTDFMSTLIADNQEDPFLQNFLETYRQHVDGSEETLRANKRPKLTI